MKEEGKGQTAYVPEGLGVGGRIGIVGEDWESTMAVTGLTLVWNVWINSEVLGIITLITSPHLN